MILLFIFEIIIPNGISIHGEETCSEMLFVLLAHRRKNLIKRGSERERDYAKNNQRRFACDFIAPILWLSVALKLVHV